MSQTPLSSDTLAKIEFGLQRIRFRRRLSHIPFFSAFALSGAIALLNLAAPSMGAVISQNSLFKIPFGLLFLVGVPCVFLVSVAGLKCPRCGKLFHCGERYRNDFTRKCLHCGLKLNGSNANAAF